MEEIILSRKKGKLYVVAPGPGGVEQTTLEAIHCIEKGDIFLCSDRIKLEFSEYIKGKPVLCNPWPGLWDYRGRPWDQLAKSDETTIEAFKKERLQLRDEIVDKIRRCLDEGQNVIFMEERDPDIFGPSF